MIHQVPTLLSTQVSQMDLPSFPPDRQVPRRVVGIWEKYSVTLVATVIGRARSLCLIHGFFQGFFRSFTRLLCYLMLTFWGRYSSNTDVWDCEGWSKHCNSFRDVSDIDWWIFRTVEKTAVWHPKMHEIVEFYGMFRISTGEFSELWNHQPYVSKDFITSKDGGF